MSKIAQKSNPVRLSLSRRAIPISALVRNLHDLDEPVSVLIDLFVEPSNELEKPSALSVFNQNEIVSLLIKVRHILKKVFILIPQDNIMIESLFITHTIIISKFPYV